MQWLGKAGCRTGPLGPQQSIPLVVLKAPRSGSPVLGMARQYSGSALLQKNRTTRLGKVQ